MMRLFRVSVAATLVGVLSGATPLLAGSAGWVSGHALDAGGRPLASLTVELVEAWRGQPVGAPLRAKVTDGRGAWSFGSVPPGDYVVRVIARDRTAGVPVSVTEASGVAGVLIVTPSLPPPAARSSQAVAAGAAAAAAGGGVGATAAAIIAAALVTAAAVASVLYARDES
jgi:hypothetical protein